MPLQMTSDLRFPMGLTTSINENAVDEFLNLIKRVSMPSNRQLGLEIPKQHFCKVSGDYYAQSSSYSWAESDLERHANNAASDAAGFIAAVYDAFEELRSKGATVPNQSHINQILTNHGIPFSIINNELIDNGGGVSAPVPEESISATVTRALHDAKSLIGTSDAVSAIDRAHTALHGFLLQLCSEGNIDLPNDATASKAFKSLRELHPALAAIGPRASEITRVLNSFAASIDAFSTLRNKASLAHVNQLLDVPEATAIVNAMYTVFRYIQDCIHRHSPIVA